MAYNGYFALTTNVFPNNYFLALNQYLEVTHEPLLGSNYWDYPSTVLTPKRTRHSSSCFHPGKGVMEAKGKGVMEANGNGHRWLKGTKPITLSFLLVLGLLLKKTK